MWVLVAALAVGVVLGLVLPVQIPIQYGRYLAVGVLAALDSALGGLRASLEDRFELDIFVSGFFANTILAAGLTYIGDRMGVELYYAALFAFGYRIFQNLGLIRRYLLPRGRARAGERQGREGMDRA
jgi:small basic protein